MSARQAEGVVGGRLDQSAPRRRSARGAGCRSGPARPSASISRIRSSIGYLATPLRAVADRRPAAVGAAAARWRKQRSPRPRPDVEGPAGPRVDQQVDVAAAAWPTTPGGKPRRRDRAGRVGPTAVRVAGQPDGSGRPRGRPTATGVRRWSGTGRDGRRGRSRRSAGDARHADRRRSAATGVPAGCDSAAAVAASIAPPTPGRARSGCRTHPWGGRRPPWCPATRAAAPRR